ncbi:LacI family DNA-binding transcriptional regulator [Phytoactinopolyspora halotolerans]|uniref:LacI family transcriptional regulator n=1 Tax=Phytoactinopolyspora halotolerans TaxID=1981512 RepID=A0A6L9SAD5_9ACTN|nr:LacI family DNA-binding transcriptional regulator [Phytoactinopolyspora halotolerans]NEE02345.1 LacI family transcriptional regulator [Phytoactinopolyspora halotolerans]
MVGKQGRSMPTIYDVARECGVAPSTVSRALSRPGRVSARTSERIHEVAARMGYQPNPLAKYLPTGRTETVVLIVSDIANPVYSPMIRGAEQAAAQAGYTLVLSDIDESPDRERDVMQKLLRTVDGFALATSRLSDAAIRTIARQRPMVTMNRVTQQVPSVVPDNDQGMRAAATHLADLGHGRVTYISGPATSWANVVRWRALRAVGEQLGMKIRRIGPYAPTVAGGWAAAADLLKPAPRTRTGRGSAGPAAGRTATATTAVIAYNDLLAIGAMQGLSDLGLSVPGDISIVGCDNILGADWCTPPLTTLAAPLRELGATGIRNLLAMIKGAQPRSRRPVVLPSQLIVRESTAPPRA